MGRTLVAREPVTFAKGTFAARWRAVLAPIPDLEHGELLAAAGAESVIPGNLDFRWLERSPLSREPFENTSIVAAGERVHFSPAVPSARGSAAISTCCYGADGSRAAQCAWI